MHLSFGRVGALLISLACSLSAYAVDPVPASDLFRDPLVQAPQLSPNGERLAFRVPTEDDHMLAMVYDRKSQEKRAISTKGDQDIYDHRWLTDDRLLLWMSSERKYANGLFVAHLKNKTSLYSILRYSVSHVISVPQVHPLEPIVWTSQDAEFNGKDTGLARINAKDSLADAHEDRRLGGHIPGTSGDTELYVQRVHEYPKPPGDFTGSFYANGSGEVVYAQVRQNGKDQLYRMLGNSWKACPVDLDEVSVFGVGDTDDELIAGVRVDPAKPVALVRVISATGEAAETLYQDDKYDCDKVGLLREPGTRKLIGFRFAGVARRTVWFDAERERLQKSLEEKFPGKVVAFVNSASQGTAHVVAVSADVAPTSYFLFDTKDYSLSPVSPAAPWIDEKRMRPMQPVKFKARDGVALEGYLTLPMGASKDAPVPMVVYPHGGPWARDVWGWDPQVQFLATRGYAVFQPNYRGSDSFITRAPVADMLDFVKMHQDVSDGTRAILKTGLIDPKRVAIMGWSFGGYLALMGATEEGSLYRCSVALSGVYDWASLLKFERKESQLRYEWLVRRFGHPKEQAEKLEAMSPLRRIDRIEIPVFVGHGVGDNIVEYKQATVLADALKKSGKPHELWLRKGEGHGMARLRNQVELAEAIEGFLAANMVGP